MSGKVRWSGVVLGVLGLAAVLVLHWMVFFWVSTERTMGVVQRIFYVHVPAAWVAFMAFGIVGFDTVFIRRIRIKIVIDIRSRALPATVVTAVGYCHVFKVIFDTTCWITGF